jgi:hypothetical protein
MASRGDEPRPARIREHDEGIDPVPRSPEPAPRVTLDEHARRCECDERRNVRGRPDGEVGGRPSTNGLDPDGRELLCPLALRAHAHGLVEIEWKQEARVDPLERQVRISW